MPSESHLSARRVYREIANRFASYLHTGGTLTSKEHLGDFWNTTHRDWIEWLTENYLPHGSGFDSGTQFDFEHSRLEKLVFITAFHHMDKDGYYNGWTYHNVTVTPSLVSSFYVAVSSINRNDIKEYIGDTFHESLSQHINVQRHKERLDADAQAKEALTPGG